LKSPITNSILSITSADRLGTYLLPHEPPKAEPVLSSSHSTLMDPLSITASIVGILGAAAKVSSLLITFVQNTKGAPKLAQAVLAEVNGLSAVLTHLQTYLLGTASSSKSRASLILVEQVIVTLTECVTTFSELEDVLGTARLESDLRIMDRVKLAMKESKVVEIQERLQRNKASLTLMLTILQWSDSPISLLLTLSSFAIQIIDTMLANQWKRQSLQCSACVVW